MVSEDIIKQLEEQCPEAVNAIREIGYAIGVIEGIVEGTLIGIVEEEMRKEGMEIRSVENENNIGNFDNVYKYISKIIDLTFEDLEWL